MDNHDEMKKWQESLLPYMTGKKEWNTGCIWVCECHPLLPYDMGYSFDCTCGGPGMPPIGIDKVVGIHGLTDTLRTIAKTKRKDDPVGNASIAQSALDEFNGN